MYVQVCGVVGEGGGKVGWVGCVNFLNLWFPLGAFWSVMLFFVFEEGLFRRWLDRGRGLFLSLIVSFGLGFSWSMER